MSKENINKISQIFSLYKKKGKPEKRIEIEIETEKRVSSNLERLKKTGIVKLLKEIKENGLNGKSFEVGYANENTEINLSWDDWYSSGSAGLSSESEGGCKILKARIDNQDRLFLQKKIIRGSSHSNYIGSESLVKENLVELVSQKIIETKAPQPQTQKRSFLDKLLEK